MARGKVQREGFKFPSGFVQDRVRVQGREEVAGAAVGWGQGEDGSSRLGSLALVTGRCLSPRILTRLPAEISTGRGSGDFHPPIPRVLVMSVPGACT